MKESDFYEWLKTQPVEDKIVSIKYKYSHEKEWTQSNEILEVDLSYEDVYVWLDDWDEGQQDIEILGCIPVSDINVPTFDRKTENSSETSNNCEHITEDGVTCAKYPACDYCLDNPLNKVKGSERLVKGNDEPTISKMEQVEVEPQMDDLQDWKDRMWAEAIVTEPQPTTDCRQTDCYMCKWLGEVDVCGRCRNRNLFAEADTEPKPKDEPITQTKTQNSNLTFEKADEPQTDCAWR